MTRPAATVMVSVRHRGKHSTALGWQRVNSITNMNLRIAVPGMGAYPEKAFKIRVRRVRGTSTSAVASHSVLLIALPASLIIFASSAIKLRKAGRSLRSSATAYVSTTAASSSLGPTGGMARAGAATIKAPRKIKDLKARSL